VPQPRKAAASRKASAKRPAAKRAPAAKRTRSSSRREPPKRLRAGLDEETLRHNLSALRDMLSRGVVVTSDRIQETLDEAVHRGRMTRQDAEELMQSIVRSGRAQTRDLIAEIESLLDSAVDRRRSTADRARKVAKAARKSPGADTALRQADRVRRAAGIGPSFPITGFDDLTAAQITSRLEDLTPPELRKVRDHERRNANRKSVLAAIEKKLG